MKVREVPEDRLAEEEEKRLANATPEEKLAEKLRCKLAQYKESPHFPVRLRFSVYHMCELILMAIRNTLPTMQKTSCKYC
ncbi:uncharacterized protein LOC129240537 [Anastrepha obliqua]|uniref:uncharacterized protein LOC129240537 n=1 Tax=Anastrepha obliqua TaxID=95512 RepID=UPI002409B80A|nr:uncharacterized protein LOC129240537 [Anastrepha obliqua]